MAIDLQYIASADLWEVFTDKDTSDFLFNGYILFFDDNQRTVGKPVYMITGSPPNYTFIPYGAYDINGAWRVNLNSQGALDNALYYFPFDANGAVDLYFVQWYSAGNVLQNTREAWPPDVMGTGGGGTLVTTNYVPNPQFLFNRTNAAVPPGVLGQINQAVTEIAPGWTFQRPMSSTAVDIVTFFNFNSPITTPPDNPRFGVEISDTDPDPADTFKYLQVTYNNVNTFASATNQFTFSFWASNTGGAINVELVLIKNFGTGGSTQTQQTLTTFSITNAAYTQYTFTFNFGLNTGMTIGPNNDDFVAVALNFPTSSAFSPVILTDFLLSPGTIAVPILPDLPEYISTYQAVAGGLPVAPTDGSYIGLPIIYDANGLNYDFSQVGKIFSTAATTPGFGELLCDGTAYDSLAVSSDGIPYSRLAQVLFDPTFAAYLFGSGPSFFASFASNSGSDNLMGVVPNTPGVTANTSNGSIPTGFSITNYQPSVPFQAGAFVASDNAFYIENEIAGLPFITTVGGAGGAALQTGFYTGTSGFSGFMTNGGTGSTQVLFITAVVPAGGAYFGFAVTTNAFYVWFTVDGAGADPAPAGYTAGLLVPLLSSYTPFDVARITAHTIAARHLTNIFTVAGSSVPAGSSFNISSPLQNYYIWYTVNGAGTDPAPAGSIGVVVPILSTDTATNVRDKTVAAMNARFFAVPYLYGYFLRGNDPNQTVDLASNFRISGNNIFGGANIGSIELSANESHSHSALFQPGGVTNTFYSTSSPGSPNINYTGDEGIYESRPVNISVNYVIKY